MSAVLRDEPQCFAPMRVEDLAAIVAIERAAYEFPWTHGNFADSLASGHSAWTLRDETRHIAAYAVVMHAVDEAHLLNLTVAPAVQRRGFGWRLLEFMAENARGYGARTMLLEVRPSNPTAQQMYLRYGFERIGVRRGYYPARAGREDAIVMRVAL